MHLMMSCCLQHHTCFRHLQVQARQGRWKEKRDRVFTAQSFRSAGFRLGTLFFMICERELFVVTGERRYCWGFETFGNSSKAELSTRNEGEIFSTRNRRDPFRCKHKLTMVLMHFATWHCWIG